MNEERLSQVSRRLNQEKHNLIQLLPKHLQDDFAREAYISGGCIYSLYNEQEPKDYDFFVESESLVKRLRDYFMGFLTSDARISLETGESKFKVLKHKDLRLVISKNAISIGKYQIITKFYGEPKVVVNEFDFKHNMFYHKNDRIDTFTEWDFLDSNDLRYNEKRARDISGTIIRVHKFVERGMKITNGEMSKMLRKLREVGFTDRENEIIEATASY